MIKLRTAIILLISIAIALIYGLFIARSWNTFLSLFLIGLWILFTIKFFEKRKEYKEYNSPKNTSFFLLSPLGIAIFYSIWSYFTGFWGDNLLEDFIPNIYISLWILIFAFPYFLYSMFTLRACYRKFAVVYIIRTKSLNARKFVIFYTILILIALIFFMAGYNIVVFTYFYYIVEQTYIFQLDLMLIFFCCYLGYLFIVRGIFGSPPSLPEVSSDYIARRRRRLENITSTPTRSTPRTNYSTQPSRITTPRVRTTTTSRTNHPRVTTANTARTTPSRANATKSSKATARKPTTTSTTTTVIHRPTSTESASFEKLKPKAGILSLEDFKCIFCFQLPQLSDQRRGIVLCPNCKHPAHADEFKDWTKSSPLCSRCDAPIPPSFRRNPKIISAREYIEVINEFKKRK
ncbi:MAG: hypothetical protein ACFE8C_11910 [Promethearchaeota archaeon]